MYMFSLISDFINPAIYTIVDLDLYILTRASG